MGYLVVFAYCAYFALFALFADNIVLIVFICVYLRSSVDIFYVNQGVLVKTG